MRSIKALAALVVLAALIVIPPLLLVGFVGSPVPSQLAMNASLSDSDLLKLLSIAAWVLWLQVAWCIVAEAYATLTARPPDRVVGTFSFQQQAIRVLITAILAMFVGGPSIAVTDYAVATTNVAAPVAAVTPVSHVFATDEAEPVSPSASATIKVKRGDSLWSLAAQYLGDGNRWHEIASLNEGRQMANGQIFHSSDSIRTDWQLLVPVDATARESADAVGDYVVKKGDTLSQISLDHLGDASEWPEVFEASRQLDQPIPMVDPDLIYPGQLIDLPGVEESAPSMREGTELGEHAAERPRISPQTVDDSASTGTSPRTSAESAQHEISDQKSATSDDAPGPGWIISGMTGAGALLAGALLLTLRQRRAMQSRFRRPGRAVPKPEPWPATVERSVTIVGRNSSRDVEWLDEVLRRLAAVAETCHSILPRLDGALLSEDTLTLLLAEPSEASAPWASVGQGTHWTLARGVAFDDVGPDPDDRPAPWPLLAAIGENDGTRLFLNLEDRAVSISGGTESAANLSRFIAAEISCNPWARHTKLSLIGLATEVGPMRPEFTRVYSDLRDATGEALSQAISTIDRLVSYEVDTATARAHQEDPDVWPSRLLVVDGAHANNDDLAELSGLLTSHRGRTGTAVVSNGVLPNALHLTINDDARFHVPFLEIAFTATSLTADEAEGCAALLAQADQFEDAEPGAFEDADGWHEYATITGGLRPEHATSRTVATTAPSSSLLEGPDTLYVETAAVTADDLEALSPKVVTSVQEAVAASDPTLDKDIADWFSNRSTRPRISLLGPVEVRGSGSRPANRRAYFTEVASLIALQPRGIGSQELAAALGISPGRMRIDVNTVREWFGIDPCTGKPYLPDARSTPAASIVGQPRYQAVNALVDLDLFRRLRLRAEAGGPEGLGDLGKALELVRGFPFDELRELGWGWLMELANRIDLDMQASIADVGHILVAAALANRDAQAAMSAAAAALRGAPHDEVLQLDIAAVLAAEGPGSDAMQFLREMVFNRSDNGGPPLDLPDRTKQVAVQLLRRAKTAT